MHPPNTTIRNGKLRLIAIDDIRDLGFCRCIDTGCSIGGVLTAREVPTGQVWQVTETGEQVFPKI